VPVRYRYAGLLLVALSCAAPPSPPPAPDPPAVPRPSDTPAVPHSSDAPAAPAPSDTVPACADALDCYAVPQRTGDFDVTRVTEASGLAASARNRDLLWLLDDGPGTAGVEVLRPDGELLGSVTVEGLDGVDTEDLAVAPCDGESCVWIADTGDNRGSRDHVEIVRFREPDLAAGLPAAPAPAERMVLRYPDGPHDAEALLVDAAGTTVLLVTKAPFDPETGQTGATRVYAAAGFGDQVLTDLGELVVPPASSPLAAAFVGAGVTGGSARPGRVLLRTYDHVVEYVAPTPDAPLTTLPSWAAHEVPSPRLPQPEAVAWAADGCGYWLVSEGSGEVWRVPCDGEVSAPRP
jgi:hypothetical protein